jgi:hypothetical protein
MEKGVVWMFVFVLLIGVVCAEGGWGDINGGDNSSDANVVANDSSDGLTGEDLDVIEAEIVNEKSGFGGRYTINFYIALGVGFVGLLIVGYFVYLFLRPSKNKWK